VGTNEAPPLAVPSPPWGERVARKGRERVLFHTARSAGNFIKTPDPSAALPPLPPLTGHPLPRRIGGEGTARGRAASISGGKAFPDKAPSLAVPSPPWGERVARKGRVRVLFHTAHSAGNFVKTPNPSAALPPLPPLTGHPLPRRIGGEGTAGSGAAFVFSTFDCVHFSTFTYPLP
jgi:hypothetical protein